MYFETDTTEDALSSIEMSASFRLMAADDPRYWKWFVLALHSGIQGAFAMALDDGSGLLVQKPKNADAMLAAFAAGTSPPEPHMDNFMRLHRKLQDGRNLPVGRLPLPVSQSQEAALRGLDEFRDEFVHFNTKGWSIDLTLLTAIARSCAEALEFLVLKSNRIVWPEHRARERARKAVESLVGCID